MNTVAFLKKKKKIKFVGLTITYLSYQKTLSLSLYIGGCHLKKKKEGKSEGKDKVKNDTKQNNK